MLNPVKVNNVFPYTNVYTETVDCIPVIYNS